MDKKLNKNIGVLQNGIKGLYHSSKYKRRVVFCCILALFMLIGGAVAIYNATLWKGTVIILSPSSGAYQRLYSKNFDVYGEEYAILEAIGLPTYDGRNLNAKSVIKFERKANVKRVTHIDNWEITLSSYGLLEEVDLNHLIQVYAGGKKHYNYLIVLDKDNKIVYQGYGRKTLIETLIQLGVRF